MAVLAMDKKLFGDSRKKYKKSPIIPVHLDEAVNVFNKTYGNVDYCSVVPPSAETDISRNDICGLVIVLQTGFREESLIAVGAFVFLPCIKAKCSDKPDCLEHKSAHFFNPRIPMYRIIQYYGMYTRSAEIEHHTS